MSVSGYGPRALLVLVLGGVLLLPASPGAHGQQGSAAAYRDTAVDEGRRIPAYKSVTASDRLVRVFSVRFWAREGERRYVTARVVARQSASTSDQLLMASVSLSCSPTTDGVSTAGATQNLLRGRSALFTPRFVYVVPRTGMVACVVYASGLRPRPSGRDTWSNVWTVGAGSSLAVSSPTASWSRTAATAASSRVLDRGESWTPLSTVTRVGADSTFRVASDHKVTTCSAVGGSSDSTTYGRNLCAGRVSTRGSLVRLVLTAVQLDRSRRPCARAQVVSTRRVVRAAVHHQMIVASGRFAVSGSRSCTEYFRVTGTLSLLGGADLLIHAPSERLTILTG